MPAEGGTADAGAMGTGRRGGTGIGCGAGSGLAGCSCLAAGGWGFGGGVDAWASSRAPCGDTLKATGSSVRATAGNP